MPELSVIIPVFNEIDNIEPLTTEIIQVLGSDSDRIEIVFVDDGSSDGTLDKIREMSERYPLVRWISFDRNYGQTAALDAGLRAARGRYLVTMDGDLQSDPSDIPGLMKGLESADLVCGYRRKRHDSFIRKISSRIANGVRNRATGDTIIDVGCTLRVMRRECIENLKLYEGMHRFFPTLVKYEGYSVIQVPVNHRPRLHGKAKYNISNRLFRAVLDLFAVVWMKWRRLRYVIKERKEP
ncbi:glycosyltransferase family 2 protein [bacterium]|nr:glycosyltransferase family 2 protein [bacterium]